MTNKSLLKKSFFFFSFSWLLFQEIQLMIHNFKHSSLSDSQYENIWHMLVLLLLLLLGFWFYFSCGKWIHQDRQTPWSSSQSPSPLFLANPKLLSMVSSWPWHVLLGEEECSAGSRLCLTHWPRALLKPPLSSSPLLPDPTPAPSIFV